MLSYMLVWCHHKVLQQYGTVSLFCIVLKVVSKCDLLLVCELLSLVFCKLAGDPLIISLWFGLFGLISLLCWDKTWVHIWIWCKATYIDLTCHFKEKRCACRLHWLQYRSIINFTFSVFLYKFPELQHVTELTVLQVWYLVAVIAFCVHIKQPLALKSLEVFLHTVSTIFLHDQRNMLVRQVSI